MGELCGTKMLISVPTTFAGKPLHSSANLVAQLRQNTAAADLTAAVSVKTVAVDASLSGHGQLAFVPGATLPDALIIIPPEATPDQTGLTAYLTAYPPNQFADLGLSSYKLKQGRLTVEGLLVDLRGPTGSICELLTFVAAGILAVKDGDGSAAEASFQQAISLVYHKQGAPVVSRSLPAYLRWWLALAYLAEGRMLGQARQFQRAEALLLEAMTLLPEDMPPTVKTALARGLAKTRYQNPSQRDSSGCESAIALLTETMRLVSVDEYPAEWANLRYERASAYYYMPKDPGSLAFTAAERDLAEALTVFDPNHFQHEYARCNNALGRLYTDWPGPDYSIRAKAADSHYAAALAVFRKENWPWQYAQTKHNLGVLRLAISSGRDCAIIDEAEACFREALEVFDRRRYPARYRATLCALGRAYLHKSRFQGETLKNAIHCFTEILSHLDPSDSPYFYARTLFELANARSADPASEFYNSALARDLYDQSSRLFADVDRPVDRAYALVGLAAALLDDVSAYDEARVAHAVRCYREALATFEPSIFPSENAYVCMSLDILSRSIGS